jgi:hypothetical protein
MASASNATVIPLQSHPAWAAAERRAQERVDAMRRHPSFQSRLHSAVLGGRGDGNGANGSKGSLVRELRVCRSDTVLEFPSRDRIR